MQPSSSQTVLLSIVVFAAGAAAVLAFSPFGFSVLAVLSPAVLMAIWVRVTPKQAFWYGWVWGAGFLGVGVFWLRVSIAQFGGVNLPLALLITFGFSGLMALYYGLVGWTASKLTMRSREAVLLAVVPAAWVLGEWLRGWVFTGFPWLTLGYSQLDTPLGGYAPLLGVFGVSYVAVFAAGLLNFIPRVWTIGLLPVLWVNGWGLQQISWTDGAGSALRVSIIQGNIPQQHKWQADQFQPTLRLYTSATEKLADSRLIVWPETAVPAYADRVEEQLLAPLHELARHREQDVLLGIPVLEPDGRYYNAMLNVGVTGRSHYFKRHLVPFGEYMPLEALLKPLIDILAIPMSAFSAGNAHNPILHAGGYPAAMSVCYEDAFGAETIEALPAAAFLVNVSNDAWFGDSLAPHQHLEIARMRALETGRYMVRATNTGVSAIIGARGELLAVAPQFEQAVLSARLEPRQGGTPYIYLGNHAIVLICVAILLLAYWFRRRCD